MADSLQVSLLDQRHATFAENAEFWRQIDLLHRGGAAIRKEASSFLVSRPMEPGQVYSARIQRFSYQNILGTSLGWYVSRFFGEEPALYLRNGDKIIEDDSFASFERNCDRAGTTLMDCARKWFVRAVLDGSVYVLIDLQQSGLAPNFLAQKASGALDPYLVTFNASQVINWGEDQYGNLEWIVIATQRCERAFGAKARVFDRWYYFDREEYRIYEAERDDRAIGPDGDSRTATVVGSGRHALADQKRVPVHRIDVPEELWLGYRVLPQVLDHLNADNTLGWALFMANLPVPVIIGDYEEPPKISETAYIKLPTGSKFEWSEPAGTSFQHSAERVSALREEIYRQMYLQAQGRTSTATASASSGYSKQLDMAPSHEVLNGFGAIFRAALAAIAKDAALIRSAAGTEIEVEVTGLVFEEEDPLGEIETVEAALALDIPSDKFEKYVQKRFIRKYARNADPKTLDEFEREIEAAPTKSQRAEDERKQMEAGFAGSLQNAMAKRGGAPKPDAEAA